MNDLKDKAFPSKSGHRISGDLTNEVRVSIGELLVKLSDTETLQGERDWYREILDKFIETYQEGYPITSEMIRELKARLKTVDELVNYKRE